MDTTLADLVARAKDGDQEALGDIVRRIQDRVYGLALRMLYHPADAEDAAQEILIKVITRLGSFRGESRFETWVWRVAANHLLTARKSRAERMELTLERYAEEIDRGVAETWSDTSAEAFQGLVVAELRLSCLNGLLTCLDRDQRLAFILGEYFELDGQQGGEVLDITPAAFRKRLSRARARLRNFLSHNCGLMNPDNPCHCSRMVAYDIKCGRLNPDRLLFATHPARVKPDPEVLERLPEADEMARLTALYRYQPDYTAPARFVRELKTLINGGAPASDPA